MKYRKEWINWIRKLKQYHKELQITLQEAKCQMGRDHVPELNYGTVQEIDTNITKLEDETGEHGAH